MSDAIPVNLAVEDALSEAVLLKLLRSTDRPFAVGTCYGMGGFGYLKRTIRGFNTAAKGTPFLVLTDLDTATCPPILISDWLPVPRHPNLLFRVAVREVEAWLLAHRDAIARFLNVKSALVPANPESLPDAKQALIRLAAKSRSRAIRDDIVPPRGSQREHGPNYNGRLSKFVAQHWDPMVAAHSAASLCRALKAVRIFTPRWTRPVNSPSRR